MIVWRGLGLLVIVFYLLFIPIIAGLMDAVMGTDWYKSNLAAILVNIAIPSLLIWLVGRKLNSTPDVKVIDPMTKDSVDARPNHSLWGISMEYWGLIGMAFFSTIEIYRWFR